MGVTYWRAVCELPFWTVRRVRRHHLHFDVPRRPVHVRWDSRMRELQRRSVQGDGLDNDDVRRMRRRDELSGDRVVVVRFLFGLRRGNLLSRLRRTSLSGLPRGSILSAFKHD